MAPGWPQDGPKTAPRRPQEGPKTAPRRPQDGSQSHLKGSFDPLILALVRGPPAEGPRCLQEAPRKPKKPPPGPLLGRSWSALGAVLGQSWGALCAMLGRSWSRLGALSGRSWGRLGAVLGLSWASLGAFLGHRGAVSRPRNAIGSEKARRQAKH